jgi:glycosyltransferase involved in cell wall biosynthesis
MNNPKVTVVLLIKNNADILEDLLGAIFNQKTNFPFEVLAIDSGSFDGSIAILKRCKHRLEKRYSRKSLRIHQIAPIDFNFGKTRNKAVLLSRGEIVVFLSTRVIPRDDSWLTSLIDPLSPFTTVLSGVVACFGKVSPSSHVGFSEGFRLTNYYGNKRIVLNNDTFLSPFTLLFSDMNAAVLKIAFRKYPYDESLILGHDQIWGRKIMEEGMSIAYTPSADVTYLRGHTASDIFKHYFTKGYFFTRDVSSSSVAVFSSWLRFLIMEIKYLIKKRKKKSLVNEIFYEVTRLIGYFLGQKGDKLPKSFRTKLLLRDR